jgi:hypothetical protein
MAQPIFSKVVSAKQVRFINKTNIDLDIAVQSGNYNIQHIGKLGAHSTLLTPPLSPGLQYMATAWPCKVVHPMVYGTYGPWKGNSNVGVVDQYVS